MQLKQERWQSLVIGVGPPVENSAFKSATSDFPDRAILAFNSEEAAMVRRNLDYQGGLQNALLLHIFETCSAVNESSTT